MIRPFRGVHPQIHETAFIADSAQIIGDVHVGEQASVWFGSVVRGDMFYIRIGDRTNVQDNCVIHTRTGEKPTILEEGIADLVAEQCAAGRLRATTDARDAVLRSDISLVCVGTPSRPNAS